VKSACDAYNGPWLVRKLLEVGWPKDVLININFPDALPESVERVEVTSQGKRDQSQANIIERMMCAGTLTIGSGLRGCGATRRRVRICARFMMVVFQ